MKCDNCNGFGSITSILHVSLTDVKTCSDCNGTGFVPDHEADEALREELQQEYESDKRMEAQEREAEQSKYDCDDE